MALPARWGQYPYAPPLLDEPEGDAPHDEPALPSVAVTAHHVAPEAFRPRPLASPADFVAGYRPKFDDRPLGARVRVGT
jgi:hypothetical protein